MGSQWPSMGNDMMSIDVFKQSVEKSHASLQQFGINLMSMIQESTCVTFSSPLNSFICIVAIQVCYIC